MSAARTAARHESVVHGLAGPALIVLVAVIVLHDVAFRGMLPGAYDLLGYWLPTHCHLGRTLAAGEIPGWNPFSLAGAPFAADPQSGWMYLPVMALYTAFSCDVAARLLVVLQPVVAGLGMYAFLRAERLSRAAATTAGLVLTLAIAGSSVAARIPFAGSLAWTAVLLACIARYLRADDWAGRLFWLALSAVSWGTLAAAHLSHGLVIGTAAAATYVIARTIGDARTGLRSGRETLRLVSPLVLSLLPVNLAFLLPRLRYLGDTTLGLGYEALEQLGANVTVAEATGLSWPLRFATSPGAYLGAVPLVLALAWGSRDRRALAVGFAAFGAVCYIGALRPVVGLVSPLADAVPLGAVYTHGAHRLQYGVLLAVPVLAAVGLDAWRAPADGRRRLAMVVPGALVWLALPLVLGVDPARLWLFAAGALAGAGALALVALRPGLALLVPALAAVELTVGGLIGQARDSSNAADDLGAGWNEPFAPLPEPDVDAAAFMRPGPIATTIRANAHARFFSEGPLLFRRGGIDPPWAPENDGSLGLQRSMLFGIEDVQGYNPVQPLRYWMLVQRANARPVLYSAGVFLEPSEEILDLLQVGWVVRKEDGAGDLAAREGLWTLERRAAPPRAEIVGGWIEASSPASALDAVLAPGFDGSTTIVLEADPRIASLPVEGRATYRPIGTQGASFTTETPREALLLIRIPYDDGWQATVDGQAAEILVADYLFQAVRVPAGRHILELRYREPTIVPGLVGTTLSVTMVLGLAAVLAWRRRRATEPTPAAVRRSVGR